MLWKFALFVFLIIPSSHAQSQINQKDWDAAYQKVIDFIPTELLIEKPNVTFGAYSSGYWPQSNTIQLENFDKHFPIDPFGKNQKTINSVKQRMIIHEIGHAIFRENISVDLDPIYYGNNNTLIYFQIFNSFKEFFSDVLAAFISNDSQHYDVTLRSIPISEDYGFVDNLNVDAIFPMPSDDESRSFQNIPQPIKEKIGQQTFLKDEYDDSCQIAHHCIVRSREAIWSEYQQLDRHEQSKLLATIFDVISKVLQDKNKETQNSDETITCNDLDDAFIRVFNEHILNPDVRTSFKR